MSINFNYYNNPSVYYNNTKNQTSNVKNEEIQEVQNNLLNEFNFMQLNEIFARDGLESLQKQLDNLQAKKIINGYNIAIDVSNNKQEISLKVGDTTYKFLGVVGEGCI